jgi:hypothetical protein
MGSKEYKRQHYQDHKNVYKERTRVRISVFRKVIAEIKLTTPCEDCGRNYPPYVMDFDHLPGTDKLRQVGKVQAFGSVVRLLAEIDKCEVVCSNCHRQRTHQREQESSIAM